MIIYLIFSEPEVKSAPVSVIQTAPPRVNGVTEQVGGLQ